MDVLIRFGNEKDVEKLNILGRDTFSAKWKDFYTNEQLEKILQETFQEDILKDQFQNPKENLYVVSEDPKTLNLVGYIQCKHHHKVKYECLPFEKTLEIKKFYILENYFGTGISKKMMNFLLNSIDETKQRIWLGVNEGNFRAIGFYEKFGFKKVGTHLFSDLLIGPNQVPDEDLLFLRT
ncbi:hypothetical protein HK099_000874, partial [Clydaea vesicula]